jgi:threonylcarbamoyladenosine tRNA methylthiotransferase MtaB
MKKVAFYTFGCKLNFAETSSISRQMGGKGYEVVAFREVADVYVIHSCTVTGNADRKTVAAIRQATRRNPEARVAVIGCMAELNPERLLKIKGVDLILGNAAKFDLAEYLEKGKVAETTRKEIEFVPSWSVHERTRSFLKIQDGCDYFCAYCTIPLARGRSRSSSIGQTLETAREMAGQGVKEVVLTGINIGDFGRHQHENLTELLKQIERVEGLQRIRISSIEPDLLHDDIIELVATRQRPHTETDEQEIQQRFVCREGEPDKKDHATLLCGNRYNHRFPGGNRR